MQIFQHTLTRTVSCTGIGLHSGRKVNLSLRPADPDTGVLFKRSDLPGAPLIPADVHHVVDTRFSTTIGVEGLTISTVEHLLSALAGSGVDNAIVEVDAPELPIMDGSAAPFVFLLKNAGLTSQARPRQFYRVKRSVSLSEEDGKSVSVSPGEGLSVDFTIDFAHPAIRTQRLGFDLDDKAYAREISRARTFGFLSDMRRLHNAVVLDSHRVLNDDGLRFPDEFVRHKVLDFLGDLALVGRPIQGRFVARKSGHDLNNKLFKKLLADPSAWQLVTPSQEEPAPAAVSVAPARPANGRVGQVSAA
jgi:UDP-3-O-[3-hydroxymyristoyl] N-acetylglucosamine deacetylase